MSDRLFRRGKVWYCWVYDAQGRRTQRSTKCTDRRAAEASLREWERRAADPAYAAAHSTTLADALQRFLVDRKMKGRASGTLDAYRVKAGHLLRIIGAETRLALVDARAVDRVIEQRLEEGAVPNTVHKELTVLRGALKVAKRRGEYTGDIAAVMPHDFSPEYEPRRRFLTAEEFRALAAELTPDRAARVAFIVATGARWGESERARLEDVDTRQGFVRLRGTKTKKAARVVPIVGDGAELIEYASRHAQGEGGLVFQPWGNVRRDLETACVRAKIAKVSPNDLRRTFATWLRQGSVEPNLIGAALGHTDSRMAERVYASITAESLGRVIRSQLARHAEPVRNPPQIARSPVGNACSACVANACIPAALVG